MTATLGDILLVFLADRPGSAYDLKQRHEQTFGADRAVDVLRVAQTLSRQEKSGYVRPSTRALPPRSPRVFTLTDAGLRRQFGWLLDVPPDAAGPDVLDRVLLAMAATERATFDAVVARCLAVLEAQRPRPGLPRQDALSVRHARAELAVVMATSAIEWVRHLAQRPRERDAAA
ncbi:hypothetical protein ACWT_3128 [Actinoplanes sp. SE50]|uniref:PadR family transcriptional regulator n=1 Tax=unclassified Actinoplanes TaxID=2626549 RepID=UPI00023EC469|nr:MULTISPECIES: PadR family transcriptional regulator [unclassified Actinoplanes]AEV84151.1 hypothetical protein ACPL_3256 [Actinoplanes sp. SE50/110]ATO82543.1 hypothetical protein ACWT_3128 [Actinoplanes sp. SE50]SLL99950.1 PadR-like family transcriptional regulator [Actinoplanes sp. SE50/110]